MTDKTKAAIRAVWEALPGLYHVSQMVHGSRRHCGITAINAKMRWMGLAIPGLAIVDANNAFLPSDGVTPEERRDCLIEMLVAGAFDDLGEG